MKGPPRDGFVIWFLNFLETTSNSFHLKKALQEGSIYASNALERLVGIHANRLGINYTEALQDMDEMTLKGLKYDFFGDTDKKPKQAISEKDFDLVVEEEINAIGLRGLLINYFCTINTQS